MVQAKTNADIQRIITDLSSSKEDADAKIKNPNSIEYKTLAAVSAFRHYLASHHSFIDKVVSLVGLVDQFIKSSKRHKSDEFTSSGEAVEPSNTNVSTQRLKQVLEKIDFALGKLHQMQNDLVKQFEGQKATLRTETVTTIGRNIQTLLGTNNHQAFNQALGESLVNHYETRERERSAIIEKIRQVVTPPDMSSPTTAQTSTQADGPTTQRPATQTENTKFDMATQIQSLKLVNDHIEEFGLNIKPNVKETVSILNDTNKMVKFLDQVILKLTEEYKSQNDQVNEAIKDLKSQRSNLLSQTPEIKTGLDAHRKAAPNTQEGIASSESNTNSPSAIPTLSPRK